MAADTERIMSNVMKYHSKYTGFLYFPGPNSVHSQRLIEGSLKKKVITKPESTSLDQTTGGLDCPIQFNTKVKPQMYHFIIV